MISSRQRIEGRVARRFPARPRFAWLALPCGGTARRVKGGERETCETRKGLSFSRRRKPKRKGFRGFHAPLTPVPSRANAQPRARGRSRAGGSSEDGARGGGGRSTSRHEKGPLRSSEPGSKGRVPLAGERRVWGPWGGPPRGSQGAPEEGRPCAVRRGADLKGRSSVRGGCRARERVRLRSRPCS